MKQEQVDAKEFEKSLSECGSNPRLEELYKSTIAEDKSALRSCISNTEALGIKMNRENKLGLLVHFSYGIAEQFLKEIEGKSYEEKFSVTRIMMTRYYYIIMKLLEAEEPSFGIGAKKS